MANCKQVALLSGTIYQEATISTAQNRGRICVKISIPEDAGSGETTWHNCYYFTSSDAEVDFLRKKLVPKAVVQLQGQYKFRKKRHDQFPVDIMVPCFYADSLAVLYSPAEDAVKESDALDDEFMQDDLPPAQYAPRAQTPTRQSFPQSAPQRSSAPAPRPHPAPTSVASAAPVAASAAAGAAFPAPVLKW